MTIKANYVWATSVFEKTCNQILWTILVSFRRFLGPCLRWRRKNSWFQFHWWLDLLCFFIKGSLFSKKSCLIDFLFEIRFPVDCGVLYEFLVTLCRSQWATLATYWRSWKAELNNFLSNESVSLRIFENDFVLDVFGPNSHLQRPRGTELNIIYYQKSWFLIATTCFCFSSNPNGVTLWI